MKYRDFSKQCMSGGAPAADAPPQQQPEAASPPAAKPATGGRAAMVTRLRACAADWKAAKTEGRTAGQKWPQFWSACNKRKKAEGM
jgi:hypothetical protein